MRRSLVTSGALRRPERAVTIHNPVDVDEVRRLAAEPCSAGGSAAARWRRPVVGVFARLHADKDHATLLRALERLDGWTLLVVGDGPERSRLEQLRQELGLGDRVHLVGHLANPYPLMQDLDAVVLPSAAEGFGLVALEAAVLGVPFIGSDSGGIGEVCALLGHRTFRQGDSTHLAQVLADVTLERREPADGALLPFLPHRVAASYLQVAGLAAGVATEPIPDQDATRDSGLPRARTY